MRTLRLSPPREWLVIGLVLLAFALLCWCFGWKAASSSAEAPSQPNFSKEAK